MFNMYTQQFKLKKNNNKNDMTYNTVESIVDKKGDKTKKYIYIHKTEMKQLEGLRDHFPNI